MTDDQFDQIITSIANGEPLRRLLREHSSSWNSWMGKLSEDDNERRYARAKETAMEALADEIMEISDNASNDWMERNSADSPGWIANGEAVQRSRLRVDTRKWLMAKLAPKKYGDKVTVGGDAANPIAFTGIEVKIVDPEG